MPRNAAVCTCTAGVIGALLLAGACMPEFDEEWEVKDLRILGIRAEPPELLPVEATPPLITVDALVVNPAAPADRLYPWELWICTPGGALCDGAEMRALLRRDRTTLDEIRHRFILSEELRRQTMEAFRKWRIDVVARLPVRLELRVFQDPGDGPVVRGVKQIYLQTESPDLPGQEPSGNPKLEKVEVDGVPVEGPIRIEPCRPVELAAWVQAPADETEAHAAFWQVYTSQGRFTTRMPALSDGPGDGVFSPSLTVTWNPCAGDEGAAYLWFVLRNGWGGIDWQEVRAAIGPS